jgi:hypothetical protein
MYESYRGVRKLPLAIIDASFRPCPSLPDVYLTPASRGGRRGVGASVPLLDAQVAESRRGSARRVAVSLFSSSLCHFFHFSAALWFPSFDALCQKAEKKRSPTTPCSGVSHPSHIPFPPLLCVNHIEEFASFCLR